MHATVLNVQMYATHDSTRDSNDAYILAPSVQNHQNHGQRQPLPCCKTVPVVAYTQNIHFSFLLSAAKCGPNSMLNGLQLVQHRQPFVPLHHSLAGRGKAPERANALLGRQVLERIRA